MSTRLIVSRWSLAICGILSGATAADGQPCAPAWSEGPAIGPAGNSGIFVFTEFDDDADGPRRPALYVGGGFLRLSDQTPLRRLARFDGQTWEAVGGGIGPSGGASWVRDLTVFDEDGPGPNPTYLFIGGLNLTMGELPSYSGPWRWDGRNFSRLGEGISGHVTRMCVWDDDGPGPNRGALYMFGNLTTDGQHIRGVSKWDGSAWSVLPFPSGWIDRTTGPLFGDLLPFDPDGPGPRPEQLHLAAEVYDPIANTAGVLCWTGSTWEILGNGLSSSQLIDLAIFDADGEGPDPAALYACGSYIFRGETLTRFGVLKWDGDEWNEMGTFNPLFDAPVVLGSFDADGAGPEPLGLYLLTRRDIRRWQDEVWTQLGTLGGGDAHGGALLSTDRGGTPTLIVGGTFSSVDGIASQSLASYAGCPRSCPADLTGDGAVDLADLTQFLTNFGIRVDAAADQGDLNGDGDVDFYDLVNLLAEFGEQCDG